MSGPASGKRWQVSGKLPEHLLEYFKTNPDEELTYSDAESKFGVTRNCISMAARRLQDQGRLEVVHVIRLPSKGRAS